MKLSLLQNLVYTSILITITRPTMALSMAIEAAQGLGIMARDSTAPTCASVGLSSDWTSCGFGLPDNFCCNTKAGNTCMPFNNNQSVICCPQGQNCSVFYQVACNVQGLNASAPDNANSSIHSVNITNGLTTCSGSGKCCPLGYTCSADSGGTCVLSNNGTSTDSASNTASSASTASNTPTQSSAATAVSLPTPTPNPNGVSPANATPSVGTTNQCSAYPATAVLVGFFPGMILGIILTIATIVCLGRGSRKERAEAAMGRGGGNDGSSPLPSPHKPFAKGGMVRTVSDPILNDTGATRVEFLRRMSRRRGPNSPRSPSASAAGHTRHSARVRSLFSGGSGGAPHTPQHQLKREPSTESITIFSPPEARMTPAEMAATTTTTVTAGGVIGARNTQWGDVINGAQGLGVRGVAAPPAFIGSPSIVDPRKRGLDGSTNIRG